jgi:hypothetical protein
MRMELGWECAQEQPRLRLRFIRIASLWRTAAAPAKASNKVKVDQEALNLGSGYRGISIAPQVNLERGKNTTDEMTTHDGLGSAQRCQKLDPTSHGEMAHLRSQGEGGAGENHLWINGAVFPHLSDKSLILQKSRTISSESGLFNGLYRLPAAIFFLRRASSGSFPGLALYRS